MLHIGLGLWQRVSGQAGGASEVLLETGDTLLLETGSAVALDTAIPAQTEATSLTGTEWTVIVQGGATKKVSIAILAEYING